MSSHMWIYRDWVDGGYNKYRKSIFLVMLTGKKKEGISDIRYISKNSALGLEVML